MFYNKQHSELNKKAEKILPGKKGCLAQKEGWRGREPSRGQKRKHQAWVSGEKT